MTQNNACSETKCILAEQIRASISCSYREKFSLQKLSEEFYLNGNHILRTFKKVTGYTPLEYHHMVRCEKACELLENTDFAISFISDMVGYSTQAHFSRIFKNIYKCTPTEYRRSHS